MASQEFSFEPAPWIPFRDLKEIDRVRNIKREDITKHWNPDYHIRVVPNAQVSWLFVADFVARCHASDRDDTKLVMILPNPNHNYRNCALMINQLRINLRNVVIFAMDEWADQDGNIAPESWRAGFGHALLSYLYANIDPELRMPRSQVNLFTNENIDHYSDLIQEHGEADICYAGPGWAGHVAFVDPDVEEWSTDLDTWKKQGARVCGLHPLTIAQNSLHGCFGMSGDLCAVPPKAATIGPREVIAAKNRYETHALSTCGTFSSWQRLTSRLCVHGPVCPQIPASVSQELPTQVTFSETAAANIEPHWDLGY